ncbi:MAG: hypothetical protein ABI599_02060 [Flavobacteriales bacterium]
MKQLIGIVAAAAVLTSCKKETVDSVPPEIALVSVGPGTVLQFEDRVTLHFTYKDGNGDLGQDDPDAYTLWVKDSRLNAADGYHIPPLAPPGEEIPIQGELEVELVPLFLLGSSGEETMTYTFHIEDRAGHHSNEIVTSPIVIVDSLPD